MISGIDRAPAVATTCGPSPTARAAQTHPDPLAGPLVPALRERGAAQSLEVGAIGAAELASLGLLRGVSLEVLSGLLAPSSVLCLATGETLLRRGQANATLYLLLDGRLTVHLDGPESDPVALLARGESVGELSVIDQRVASADVVAAAPSRLLALDEEGFWRLVRASHAFAANLLQLFARRMRATNTTANRLDHASTVDGLTGLRNRRWLEQHLERLVAREVRDGRPLSVAMVDLDRFKSFNDDHGHEAGDTALVEVSDTLVNQIRPLDFAARYGGEELVVIFPATDESGAAVAMERVRRTVAALEIALPAGGVAQVTLSAGVAEVIAGDTPVTLLRRADRALYRAKTLGRNRVVSASAAGAAHLPRDPA